MFLVSKFLCFDFWISWMLKDLSLDASIHSFSCNNVRSQALIFGFCQDLWIVNSSACSGPDPLGEIRSQRTFHGLQKIGIYKVGAEIFLIQQISKFPSCEMDHVCKNRGSCCPSQASSRLVSPCTEGTALRQRWESRQVSFKQGRSPECC